MRKKIEDWLPVFVMLLYGITYFIALSVITEQRLLVDVKDLTWDNIGARFLLDFLLMLLLPIILMVVNRKNLKEFSIRLNQRTLLLILVGIMIVLFMLHSDYTLSGGYRLYFHLVVVASAEEFLFRGYVYGKMKSKGKTAALLVSGTLWGMMHSILPGLAAGDQIADIGVSMISQVGFGIAAGWYFIYIMEKSATLLLPIFVHAILNYTVGPLGVIVAIGVFLYLSFYGSVQVMGKSETQGSVMDE